MSCVLEEFASQDRSVARMKPKHIPIGLLCWQVQTNPPSFPSRILSQARSIGQEGCHRSRVCVEPAVSFNSLAHIRLTFPSISIKNTHPGNHGGFSSSILHLHLHTAAAGDRACRADSRRPLRCQRAELVGLPSPQAVLSLRFSAPPTEAVTFNDIFID